MPTNDERYAAIVRRHADATLRAAAEAAAEVLALRYPAASRPANHRALARHLERCFRESVRELDDRTTPRKDHTMHDEDIPVAGAVACYYAPSGRGQRTHTAPHVVTVREGAVVTVERFDDRETAMERAAALAGVKL